MPKHPKYKIESGIEKPPHKRGRHKSINNDDALVARGVEGRISGTHKSYLDAATTLAPESRTYANGKYSQIGDISSIIERLRRKISAAYKLALQTKHTD